MSGISRISIPPSLQKTIQDIKEIAGKHRDEDVYMMLKECNMDPNETAQKLLYLDTFHEVKNKRDRRKVSSNDRALEENRQRPGMQRRGTRVGNNYSHNFEEGVGGRQLSAQKQNGYSIAMRRSSKSFTTVSHKERSTDPVVASSTAPADSSSICDGSYSHESTFHLVEGNIRRLIEDAKAGYENKSKKLALRPLTLKQFSMSYPGPTPTLTPTKLSKDVTEDRNQGSSFKRNSSCLGDGVASPTVSDMYSSASDSVLEPSLCPRNSSSVGMINNKADNQQDIVEVSDDLHTDSRMNAVQNVTSGQAISGSVDLNTNNTSIEHRSVERTQATEPSPLPSSTSHHIAAGKDNQESCSVRQVNGPLKAPAVASEDDPLSHPTLEGPEQTSEIDVELDKMQISDNGQSVIFPNHLRVPEALKRSLTFGSLDAPVQPNNEDSKEKDVPVPTNVEAKKEPSQTHQSPSPASGGNDRPDHVQSPAMATVNSTASNKIGSSCNARRYDQSKQEMLQHVGRSHNPLLPSTPDYGLNLTPPIVGLHIKLDGHQPRGAKNSQIPSKAGSTPSMAQPRGIPQRSIAVSPPLFPLLQQPYPPNYIPYSPYFSQLYMPPQNAHQLLSHSGYPQQPSAGNMYMPPTAAATSGVKFPIYKPGHMSGNLPHFGISSCYGSFGASGHGYASSAALPHGPNGNNGIARSASKENDMYSTLKQDNMHVLSSVSVQDLSALQANMFYNLPQGQPVAFPPAQVSHNSFTGIYHPGQSMSTPSMVQSLHQPPQSTGATVNPFLILSRGHTHDCGPYHNSSADTPIGTKNS